MQIWPIIVLLLLISGFLGKERLRAFGVIPHIAFNSVFKVIGGIHMGIDKKKNHTQKTDFCLLAESLESSKDSFIFQIITIYCFENTLEGIIGIISLCSVDQKLRCGHESG